MSFASIWSENFFHLRDSFGGNCSFKLLRFQSGLTPGKVVGSNKSNLRLLATNAEEKNQRSQSKKPCSINLSLHDGSIRSCSSGSINNSKLRELKVVQCYNLPHISARKVSDSPAVIIVFDIETTGLSRQNERIIEIAFRVLYGGKNSTFQTLVNPGMKVTNADIHGIRSDMVNGPDVPRFEELLPILLQFIKSCQRDGKKIAFVAHNARRFDVPFLIKEFQRCKVEVPEDWLFVDTLPLAKKLRKLDGSNLVSCKLDDVRRYYKIPLIGPAHRAMQDVNTLSYVLQKMTFQLKLTIPELLDAGFRASDLTKAAPKQRAASSNSKEE